MPANSKFLQNVSALKLQLDCASNELSLLAALIMSNPDYQGNWKDHKQFRNARREFRIAKSQAISVLQRRQDQS
jgi:hypothetical protein